MDPIDKEKLINKVVEVQQIGDKIESNITAGTIMDKNLQEELLEKLQYELVELKLLIGELEDDLPRNHP
jgi:hypothetical protein|tara:strand:+ start:241 stop:447 length:207 start_codon:yes stop_codon:yes gene_type:complete